MGERIAGRTVFITGAASGIGAATARAAMDHPMMAPGRLQLGADGWAARRLRDREALALR